jgi:hypothetical protein
MFRILFPLLLRPSAVSTPAAAPSEFAPNLPSGLTLYGDTFPLGNFAGNSVFRDGFAFTGDARIADNAATPALGTVIGSHTVSTTSGLWRNMTEVVGPYGTGCTDFVYPEGLGGGANNVFFFTSSNRGWVRMHVAISLYIPPDYIWHGNTQKGLYPIINSEGFDSKRTDISFRLNGTGETPNGETCGFGFNSQLTDGSPLSETLRDQAAGSTVRLRRGQWHNIEYYMQANTPGNADGLAKAWINGVLAFDESGLRYADDAFTSQATFNSGVMSGTRGGGANTGFPIPPEGIFFRFNRMAVYGSVNF